MKRSDPRSAPPRLPGDDKGQQPLEPGDDPRWH